MFEEVKEVNNSISENDINYYIKRWFNILSSQEMSEHFYAIRNAWVIVYIFCSEKLARKFLEDAYNRETHMILKETK